MYALKNDALTSYFPAKYFISESLRNGVIPWWNPFINYGYPMHADITSTFWSPVTWFFSIFFGYSIYTVHIEFLFYCIGAATGMYRLCKLLGIKNKAAFITGLSYACSGIFIGHAQHTNWISASAMLPWLFYYFQNLTERPTFKNSVRLSFIGALFIVTSHSNFLICTLYIFIVLGIIFIFRNNKEAIQITTMLFSSIIIAVILTAGYLFSIVELMPYIFRGKALLFSETSNPFAWSSMTSFLFPFSTITNKGSLNDTDLAVRNGYMGLIILINSLLMITLKKNLFQRVFFVLSVIFLLISAGTVFTRLFNEVLPLGGYIRLIGFFRIYALFFLFLSSGFTLQQVLDNKIESYKIQRIVILLIGITIICLILSASVVLASNSTSLPVSLNGKDIKDWIGNLTFHFALLIQSIIQLFLLLTIFFLVRKKKMQYLAFICFIDLLISSGLNTPFTVTGQKSVKEIQSLLDQSPKGFSEQQLIPIEKKWQPISSTDKIIGNWDMYGKVLGSVNQQLTYPNFFTNNFNYFKTGLNNVSRKTSFAFFADSVSIYTDSIRFTNNDSATCFFEKKSIPSKLKNFINAGITPAKIIVTKSTPDSYRFRISSTQERFFVFKQNYYKNWHAKIDGKRTDIFPCNYTFMSILTPSGEHEIEFTYRPENAIRLSYISMFVFIILLIYLCLPPKTTNKYLS